MLTKESIVHQHSMQDYRNKKKEVVIPVLKDVVRGWRLHCWIWRRRWWATGLRGRWNAEILLVLLLCWNLGSVVLEVSCWTLLLLVVLDWKLLLMVLWRKSYFWCCLSKRRWRWWRRRSCSETLLDWDHSAGLRRKGCCPGLLLMMTLKAVGKSSKNALGWK